MDISVVEHLKQVYLRNKWIPIPVLLRITGKPCSKRSTSTPP